MSKIKCLVVSPNKEPELVMLDNTLEAFQSAVGGYIECLPIRDNSGVVMVLNEEGKLLGLPQCRSLACVGFFDVVCGDFVIVGSDEYGDFASLTDEQVSKYKEVFKL